MTRGAACLVLALGTGCADDDGLAGTRGESESEAEGEAEAELDGGGGSEAESESEGESESEAESESEGEGEGEAGDLSVLELGDRALTADGGLAITVPAPADVLSWLVVLDGFTPFTVSVDRIVAPGGGVVWDRTGRLDDFETRAGAAAATLAVLLPTSGDLPAAPGEASVEFSADADFTLTVRATVLVRHGAAPASGSLAVRVVLVSLPGLDAGSAATDADLAITLAAISSPLGEASVLVTTEFADLAAPALSSIAGVDVPGGELAELLAEAEDGRHVTLFLVNEIRDGAGEPVTAIAGGTPGPATLGGTFRSGVALALSAVRDDPAAAGAAAAHEVAHFLGLFHTSEPDGSLHDPIADTAECEASDDADGNGTLAPDECPDGANLMFPSPRADAGTLTEGQAFVLLRSPLVTAP